MIKQRQRFPNKNSLYVSPTYPTPLKIPKRFVIPSEHGDGSLFVISLIEAIKVTRYKTYMYTSDVDKFIPISNKPPEIPNPWAWTAVWSPPYSVANMVERTINHSAIMRENWEEITEEDYTKLFLTMDTEDVCNDRFK